MAEANTEQLVADLERVMRDAAGEHEALLELVTRHRQALAAGKHDAVAELCRLENEKIQRISELEKSRQQLAARLTLAVKPDATEPIPLRELAEQLPEPLRSRLLTQRAALRQRMEQVREQTGVARRATDQLRRHVHGLVQTVQRFASGGAAYDGQGATPAGPATSMSTVNLVA